MKIYKVILLGCIILFVSVLIATEENAVGVTTLSFFDSKSGKNLIAKIWYPTSREHIRLHEQCEFGRDAWEYQSEAYNVPVMVKDNEKAPLIIWSHGFGGDRFNNSWFAHALARHGYIVAALDHYKANFYREMDAYYFSRPWNRPQEISFLITSLLNKPGFKSYIDPDKIAAAGFSQGGVTALWLAGARACFNDFTVQLSWAYEWAHKIVGKNGLSQVPHAANEDYIQANASYRDPRVKAIIALSPGLGKDAVFTDQSLRDIAVPVLILSGDTDDIVPAQLNAQRFAELIPRAQLVILPDVGHWAMLNKCSAFGRDLFSLEFCNDNFGIDRDKIHKSIEADAIRFLDALFSKSSKTNQAKTGCLFL